MHFPLDILIDCLEDQGVSIVKKPTHPKHLFDWVSAIPDFIQSAKEQTIVLLFDGMAAASSATPKIVILRPDEDEAAMEALAPDDMLVHTNMPAALLADRIQRFLFSIIQWNDTMARMVDEGCISQDLLKESEPMLASYIGLSDANYAYIAHTPDIAAPDEVSRYFIEHRTYPATAIQETRDLGLIARWDHQDWTVVSNKPNPIIPYSTISRVIKRHGLYAAHILLISPTHVSATTRFLFDLLAAKIEACLRRHWRLENPLEQRYSYFLQEVLKGNAAADGRLSERAQMHNIPSTGAFTVCVVSGVWKIGSANFLAKRLLEAEPECKTVIEEDDVIVLLCTEAGREEDIEVMEDHIFKRVAEMNIEVGVSERVEQLELISLALEQARQALRYGSVNSSRYVAFDGGNDELTRKVFRFRRYFPYCALDQYENNSKFVGQVLIHCNPLLRLRDTDAQRGSNDLELLRTYLYCSGHTNKVCQLLHMHRNTVLYRLDKIRQVIDYDLEDADVRQYLRTMYFMTT